MVQTHSGLIRKVGSHSQNVKRQEKKTNKHLQIHQNQSNNMLTALPLKFFSAAEMKRWSFRLQQFAQPEISVFRKHSKYWKGLFSKEGKAMYFIL